MKTDYDLIIWNEPAFDYATFTTFDVMAFDWLRLCFMVAGADTGATAREANVMQYEGLKFEHGFTGTGSQKGLQHYMVTVSGAVADSFVREVVKDRLMCNSLKCTRLDVQLTTKEGEERDNTKDVIMGIFERVCAAYEKSSGEKGGRPRKILHLNGRNDGSTVYIGAMGADRLIRCYEKQGLGAYGVRYEAQLRRAIASVAFRAIVGGTTALKLLNGEMALIPDTYNVFEGYYRRVNDGSAASVRIETELTTLERKIVWLQRQVAPTLQYVREEIGDASFDVLIRNLCSMSLTQNEGSGILDNVVMEYSD